MATTMKHDAGILELTVIDADWDYAESKPVDWPVFPRWNCWMFYSEDESDIFIVKSKIETGPRVARLKMAATDADSDARVIYFNGARCTPFIDFGDCTFGGSTEGIIMILWRNQD